MIIVIIVHNVIEYTVVMYNYSFYYCISFALCAVFTEVFLNIESIVYHELPRY